MISQVYDGGAPLPGIAGVLHPPPDTTSSSPGAFPPWAQLYLHEILVRPRATEKELDAVRKCLLQVFWGGVRDAMTPRKNGASNAAQGLGQQTGSFGRSVCLYMTSLRSQDPSRGRPGQARMKLLPSRQLHSSHFAAEKTVRYGQPVHDSHGRWLRSGDRGFIHVRDIQSPTLRRGVGGSHPLSNRGLSDNSSAHCVEKNGPFPPKRVDIGNRPPGGTAILPALLHPVSITETIRLACASMTVTDRS